MDYRDVIGFWFEEIKEGQWYKKDLAFDEMVRNRFQQVTTAVSRGELYSWRKTAEGRLAEVICLDQFTRNMYRNQPESFGSDTLALILAQEAIGSGADQELDPRKRCFLYMPFMHSESTIIHEVAVGLFTTLNQANNLEYEMRHKAIIDRFGRYPHRNAVLGRDSSPEEEAFLGEKGSSF